MRKSIVAAVSAAGLVASLGLGAVMANSASATATVCSDFDNGPQCPIDTIGIGETVNYNPLGSTWTYNNSFWATGKSDYTPSDYEEAWTVNQVLSSSAGVVWQSAAVHTSEPWSNVTTYLPSSEQGTAYGYSFWVRTRQCIRLRSDATGRYTYQLRIVDVHPVDGSTAAGSQTPASC